LDEIDSGWSFALDEVHPLIAHAISDVP